jgi:hypothetical protein
MGGNPAASSLPVAISRPGTLNARSLSSGYFDGRPIQGHLLPSNNQDEVSTEPGQLHLDTDRRIDLRLAQLALAIALILMIKLIDWRNRYSPTR